MDYTIHTAVSEIREDPLFQGKGHLLFPQWNRMPLSMEIKDLKNLLPWYSEIHAETSVRVFQDLHDRAAAGETVIYSFYRPEEIAEDPTRADTGLVFFRGRRQAPTAVCCAGGGFMYVGAIHDSFPHGLVLSEMGYNAFCIIYRPEARLACIDLSRALVWLFDHAAELEISMQGYSLWGGSAGARMAAWVGTFGTEAFGYRPLPRPAAVIMQYTGLSEVTGNEPPTYACVGTADWIANAGVMKKRIETLRKRGIPAKIEIFPGLSHGFGLGLGTVAEGWIDRAAAFWKKVSP
jgi:acetyl esterase/lipase